MKRIDDRTVELETTSGKDELTAKAVYDVAEEIAGPRRAKEIMEAAFPWAVKDREFWAFLTGEEI